jgi:hypothetical protein
MNAVGRFFMTPKNVATERKLSDTTGNVFNIDLSGIQINNKPDCIIKENESKNIHVLSSGEKRANITMIFSCNVAGQFMPYALSNVQRRQQETDCGDSLPLGSDVYVGWKSSYILKDLFVN